MSKLVIIKIRSFQGLFAGRSFVGIDLKAFHKKISKFLIVLKNLIDSLHENDVLPFTYVLSNLMVFDFSIRVKYFSQIICTWFNHPFRNKSLIFNNHCKMFMILMRIEQQISSIKFNNYTPDRPHITDFVPLATF